MTPGALRLCWTPDLQEVVVVQEIERRLRAGDRALHDEYRAAADRLYVRHDGPAARSEAFQALHARLFERLQCGRPIEEALATHGFRFAAVLVMRAWSTAEEGVELNAGAEILGIRVTVQRFGTEGLRRFLDHELGHVADMMDPAFGYGEVSVDRPAARRAMGDRFGLLWDCVVDGRTAREGREPLATLAHRCAHFRRWFPGLSENDARVAVERLWDGRRPTYRELVTFARDPAALAAWAGVSVAGGGASADAEAPPPVPGAPCPLCGFPTYDWERAIPEDIAARIVADFPGWSRADGACGRCVEGYSLDHPKNSRSEFWGTPIAARNAPESR